ncbi:MAG: CBS domain-containing protein [Granulosicoccus sp.]|jgi:CBS domain-containing protein
MNTQTPLRNLMTKDLTVIQLDTPFHKIKSIFDANSFHHLPVVDKMAMVKGIISKSDFTPLTYQLSNETTGKTYSKKAYNNIFAKDIMTKNPVFLNPEDSIGLAADLFLENVYHAIPIMEDGVLVGIITTHDLLAFAFYKAPVGN